MFGSLDFANKRLSHSYVRNGLNVSMYAFSSHIYMSLTLHNHCVTVIYELSIITSSPMGLYHIPLLGAHCFVGNLRGAPILNPSFRALQEKTKMHH